MDKNNISPSDIDTYRPFIGSKFRNLELEQAARALVSHLVSCGKTFQDKFTLADMGNIRIEQLHPLIDIGCVVAIAEGTESPKFIVTDKFIDIVSEFRKK